MSCEVRFIFNVTLVDTKQIRYLAMPSWIPKIPKCIAVGGLHSSQSRRPIDYPVDSHVTLRVNRGAAVFELVIAVATKLPRGAD